jgi:hypothetical protein
MNPKEAYILRDRHQGAYSKAVPTMRFDGITYDHARDSARLGDQMAAVLSVMADGKWRTLADIASETNSPEASISARLRDLRKERFGGHTVNRHFVRRGLFQYQLVVRETEAA